MEIKKFISIIIIIANIGLLQAQYTAIPDSCFEQHLIDLSIDSEGTLDGQVLTNDINTITELTMNGYDENFNTYYGCYIDSLEGIDDFTSLETLNINRNGVQYIDVSNLPNLKKLYCDDNYTQTLALPPSIEIVYARYNRFNQNIDLSQTINLKELYVRGLPYDTGYPSYSHLTFLDLSNCIKLTKLDIGYNDFTNIDISHNVLLKELNILVNQIDTFIHNNNIALERLQAHFNNFTTIDITNLIGLKYINLSFNNIDNIDLSQNINLEIIGLTHNNTLTSVDLRNGHNNLITILYCNSTSNLTCIYVDDVQYAQDNWELHIDSNINFVETEEECENLSINETALDKELLIYPNPVKRTLNIEITDTSFKEIIIYSILGKEIIRTKKNKIDLSSYGNGIYIVKILTNNIEIISKKIIKIGA